MDVMWAVIYGLIQGLTEFLPVSSSGHLALIPYFFELKDPGVVFDLVMHLGTALAVSVYFKKDIIILFKELIRIPKQGIKNSPYAFNFCIATISSVVAILLIKDFALSYGRNAYFIAFNLIFFGILLGASDLLSKSGVDLIKESKLRTAIFIGIAQALAVFPGVSRSGVTLTAARFQKMGRKEAGSFSFLLSLPIIMASIFYKLPGILNGEAVSESMLIILVGVFVSFIVGILTIHFFLKLIAKIGLVYFTYYRIALGGFILWMAS